MEHLAKAKTAKLSELLPRRGWCGAGLWLTFAPQTRSPLPARLVLINPQQLPDSDRRHQGQRRVGKVGEAHFPQAKPRDPSRRTVSRHSPQLPRTAVVHKVLTACAPCSYIDNSNFREALALITALLRELKKLDDKMVLTEVHLLESRVHHALVNLPKSKVSNPLRT